MDSTRTSESKQEESVTPNSPTSDEIKKGSDLKYMRPMREASQSSNNNIEFTHFRLVIWIQQIITTSGSNCYTTSTCRTIHITLIFVSK